MVTIMPMGLFSIERPPGVDKRERPFFPGYIMQGAVHNGHGLPLYLATLSMRATAVRYLGSEPINSAGLRPEETK